MVAFDAGVFLRRLAEQRKRRQLKGAVGWKFCKIKMGLLDFFRLCFFRRGFRRGVFDDGRRTFFGFCPGEPTGEEGDGPAFEGGKPLPDGLQEFFGCRNERKMMIKKSETIIQAMSRMKVPAGLK